MRRIKLSSLGERKRRWASEFRDGSSHCPLAVLSDSSPSPLFHPQMSVFEDNNHLLHFNVHLHLKFYVIDLSEFHSQLSLKKSLEIEGK